MSVRPLLKNLEKAGDQCRRFLQVRGHHRQKIAAGALQPRGDGGKRPEAAAERNQLRGQRKCRKPLPKNLQRPVRASVHHEDGFEFAGDPGAQLDQFVQQPVETAFIHVNRDDKREHLSLSAGIGSHRRDHPGALASCRNSE